MTFHPIEGYIRDGEIRRVIALSAEHVGLDAVIDFGDLDRTGQVYRSVVESIQAPGGISVGDECLIRFRVGKNLANPRRWEFVERCVEAGVELPVEQPSCA